MIGQLSCPLVVFFYLILLRIEELTFRKLSKYVKAFGAQKMSRMLAFLFDPVVLEGPLNESLCRVFDANFVRVTPR